MQIMLILYKNDLDEEVWNYNPNEIALPLLFNKRDSTKKLASCHCSLLQQYFFWCTSNMNSEKWENNNENTT